MITIDKSKMTTKPQFCVINYKNKEYLEKLFQENQIEAEVFDLPDIESDPDKFFYSTHPFWYMFFEHHTDKGDSEALISVISTNIDSEYLRELLEGADVHQDYYSWWKDNEDKPFDNYQAWAAFDKEGVRPQYVSKDDADFWYDQMMDALLDVYDDDDVPTEASDVMKITIFGL